MTKPAENKNTAAFIKKVQQRNLLVIGVVAAVLIFSLYYAFSAKNPPRKAKDKIVTTEFASPLDKTNPQTYWMESAQNKLAQQTRQEDTLKTQMQLLQQNKQTQDKSVQQQSAEIHDLQMQLQNLQHQVSQGAVKTQASNGAEFVGGSATGASGDYISDVSLNLVPHPGAWQLQPQQNPDTFVPAGTFVRAITLGGADASAGVTSQADPSPMLFRILDQGTLPNHKTSYLKNCMATAAAIGDISSERGQIRLERLSCTKDNGEIVEMPVEATVFGPDGKNGVRGNALWREGALLERAFAAGTLSGISNGIGQSYTTTSLNPLGQTQTVNNGHILQYGLASGVGNAADKLADYNIQRAEQYHPVIQLSAGTVVDIVFLKGFYLDGKKHPDNSQAVSSNVNNANTDMALNNAPNAVNQPSSNDNLFNNVSNNSGNAALPLTPEQIAVLKQKNAEQGFN